MPTGSGESSSLQRGVYEPSVPLGLRVAAGARFTEAEEPYFEVLTDGPRAAYLMNTFPTKPGRLRVR
jgi:hypothetical protein